MPHLANLKMQTYTQIWITQFVTAKKQKKKKKLVFEIQRFQRQHHVNIDSDANCFMHKQHANDEFGL